MDHPQILVKSSVSWGHSTNIHIAATCTKGIINSTVNSTILSPLFSSSLQGHRLLRLVANEPEVTGDFSSDVRRPRAKRIISITTNCNMPLHGDDDSTCHPLRTRHEFLFSIPAPLSLPFRVCVFFSFPLFSCFPSFSSFFPFSVAGEQNPLRVNRYRFRGATLVRGPDRAWWL